MARKPKSTDWSTTPNARRRRRMVTLTLSDEARLRLDELAHAAGETRSGMVERLVRDAK